MRTTHHSVLGAAILAASTLGLAAGCEREGPAERAGEKIDDAAEKAGEKIEEAGEKIQDAAKDANP